MEELKKLGLTEYGIQSYLALLRAGPTTGYDLSNYCDVPLSRIYDALNGLAAKGLATILPGKPKIFQAVEPSVALNTLLRERDAQWKKERENIKEIIKNISTEKTESFVEFSEGSPTYLNKAALFMGSLKKEAVAMGSNLTGAQYEHLFSGVKDLAKKNIRMRALTPVNEENKYKLMTWKKAGVQIRDYTPKGMSFIICDHEVASLSICDNNFPKKRVTLYVRSSPFVDDLMEIFEIRWAKSKPL